MSEPETQNTDVAVPADLTVVPPQTYSIKDLKPGMTVVFVDHTLNEHPIAMVSVPLETNAAALAGKLAKVIAVDPHNPGKQVAVCFKEKIEFGHSCDGRVPHGYGAYVLPEHLYSEDAHAKHTANHKAAAADQAAIDEMLKGFVTP